MICGWNELLSILPGWLAQEVDIHGKNGLQEIRLRLNQPPQLTMRGKMQFLTRKITMNELNFCVNTATKYSPWAATTIAEGYISAPGGHRVGVCGDAIMQGGQVKGIRNVRSLCVRVAGDYPGIAAPIADLKGSILIIGSPGSGKTTLLRDLVRQLSAKENVCVIDQRGELFPECFQTGRSMDILSSCEKNRAIDILLRTMGPDTIAMDEITRDGDCDALRRAAWCGVRLIATAHAANEDELQQRIVYRPILQDGIFDTLIVLDKDKTFKTERI